jgi:hypothetical protein
MRRCGRKLRVVERRFMTVENQWIASYNLFLRPNRITESNQVCINGIAEIQGTVRFLRLCLGERP